MDYMQCFDLPTLENCSVNKDPCKYSWISASERAGMGSLSREE